MHLHYGEKFAVIRCRLFNIHYRFSLKSGRYVKETIVIRSVVFRGIYNTGWQGFWRRKIKIICIYELIFRTYNLCQHKIWGV